MWLAEAADGLASAQLGASLFLVVLVKFFEVALDERRLNGTGADGVDAQDLWIFDGKLARHCDHSALSGAVCESLLDADQTGNGCDVDDGPDGMAFGSGREKQREGCARDEVDGANVDVQQAVEVFGLG